MNSRKSKVFLVLSLLLSSAGISADTAEDALSLLDASVEKSSRGLFQWQAFVAEVAPGYAIYPDRDLARGRLRNLLAATLDMKPQDGVDIGAQASATANIMRALVSMGDIAGAKNGVSLLSSSYLTSLRNGVSEGHEIIARAYLETGDAEKGWNFLKDSQADVDGETVKASRAISPELSGLFASLLPESEAIEALHQFDSYPQRAFYATLALIRARIEAGETDEEASWRKHWEQRLPALRLEVMRSESINGAVPFGLMDSLLLAAENHFPLPATKADAEKIGFSWEDACSNAGDLGFTLAEAGFTAEDWMVILSKLDFWVVDQPLHEFERINNLGWEGETSARLQIHLLDQALKHDEFGSNIESVFECLGKMGAVETAWMWVEERLANEVQRDRARQGLAQAKLSRWTDGESIIGEEMEDSVESLGGYNLLFEEFLRRGFVKKAREYASEHEEKLARDFESVNAMKLRFHVDYRIAEIEKAAAMGNISIAKILLDQLDEQSLEDSGSLALAYARAGRVALESLK